MTYQLSTETLNRIKSMQVKIQSTTGIKPSVDNVVQMMLDNLDIKSEVVKEVKEAIKPVRSKRRPYQKWTDSLNWDELMDGEVHGIQIGRHIPKGTESRFIKQCYNRGSAVRRKVKIQRKGPNWIMVEFLMREVK